MGEIKKEPMEMGAGEAVPTFFDSFSQKIRKQEATKEAHTCIPRMFLLILSCFWSKVQMLLFVLGAICFSRQFGLLPDSFFFGYSPYRSL